MNEHDAYTELDWQRDAAAAAAGSALVCPDCGSDKNYGPRWHRRVDGTERHYRACKNCGFWQEADGTRPYRVWLPMHACRVRLRQDQRVFHCSVCDHTLVADQPGDLLEHQCGKYLTPWESGYSCPNCERFLDLDCKTELPSMGSDRPAA